MGDLIIKPTTGSGNKLIIQTEDGTPIVTTSDSAVDSATSEVATKTGTETLTNKTLSNATLSTPTIANMADCIFPAGHVLQIVHGTGGDNSPVTHNGATWTNLETLSTTITVKKGNKVLVIANSIGWFTTGTNNYNGQVRIRLTDGTNEGLSNSVLLWTQNFGLSTGRLYGTSHSGLLTTAAGSGTVVVTAYVQASSEAQGTVNYGDTNTNHNFGYTLMEIQG